MEQVRLNAGSCCGHFLRTSASGTKNGLIWRKPCAYWTGREMWTLCARVMRQKQFTITCFLTSPVVRPPFRMTRNGHADLPLNWLITFAKVDQTLECKLWLFSFTESTRPAIFQISPSIFYFRTSWHPWEKVFFLHLNVFFSTVPIADVIRDTFGA